MRVAGAVLGFLVALALVGLLAFRRPPPAPAPPPPPASAGSAQADDDTSAPHLEPAPEGEVSPQGEAGERKTDSAGATATASKTAESLPAFRARLASLAKTGTKHSYRELLSAWRSGKLDRARERAIDDVLAKAQQADHPPKELDTAAGKLLLEGPDAASQRKALASLLATSGSELAVGYLFAAAKKPELAAEALAAIKTVSNPGVLPLYARELKKDLQEPQLVEAIRASLRNIDTPKARDLEQKLP